MEKKAPPERTVALRAKELEEYMEKEYGVTRENIDEKLEENRVILRKMRAERGITD